MSRADPRTGLPGYAATYFTDWVVRDVPIGQLRPGPRTTRLLLRQWQRPRRLGIVAAILAEIGRPPGGTEPGLEDVLRDLLIGTNLETATGAALDQLGKILVVGRNGMVDEAFRLRLRVEILILKSNGHPDDVMAILNAALPRGITYRYAELAVATVSVEAHGAVNPALAATVEGFLVRAKSAGTRALLVSSSSADDDTFTFSGDTSSPFDSHRGWGDAADPTTGGELAGVYT